MSTAVTGPAWDLDDEYTAPDGAQVRDDFAAIDDLFRQIEAAQVDGLAVERDASVGGAQAIFRLAEQAGRLISNLGVYANCLLSVDSAHDGAQALQGRLISYQKRFAELTEPLSQFTDLADETAIDAYLADPEVGASEFLVRHNRKRSFELLSLAEENLQSSLAQDGIHAWGRLYDQLTGSMVCNVPDGNDVLPMGVAAASGRLLDADDAVRRGAWHAINDAFTVHEEACTAAINAIAGWRLEMNRKRGTSRPVHYLDAPVHANRIERQTLDVLMASAAEARPLAQRAARLQARAYGKERVGPWDVRAPAPALADGDGEAISFDNAINLIADAYGQVDPGMAEFVHMIAERRWIEGTVGDRKRPGAYCTGFARSRNPRVYMTYTGGVSNVITLAHELGHAYHSWVMRDLPDSQRSYGMSLAETASTFGETLVRDALLAQAPDARAKLAIAWEELAAISAFLLNIPARFEFETRFYDARAERPQRPDALRDMMSQAWTTWYGDALSEPDPMFWASKLHFYISGLSFYNFPYLFGFLFSLSVYARRSAFGAEFHDRYVGLLRDTGRMTAEDLTRQHLDGDLGDAAFWRETIASLGPKVDAFEGLLDEAGL